MIVYLDTSALVKLYIAEEGTHLVQKAVNDSSLVATSKVAYAEARAAFTRAFRENIIKNQVYYEIIAVLKQDWNSYFKLEITDELIELAGELTQTHSIRGFYAIHLSSAITLSHMLKQKITTICFDVRLWNALKTYDFFDVLPENCHKK
ncbi:MAG: type II toxin-antitoxin system VapC family toxin [Thermovenabulum sp.]|uniref:type II toxin-antitoxin system VapC family toxin n=1 Tax=Thermovenabulum sp. TaxID=3100335 RepID=UPI003C7E7472